MTILRTSSEVPAPVGPTDAFLLSSAETSLGGSPVSRRFTSGEPGTELLKKLNRNALSVDLLARFGGGTYAVATGLSLASLGGLLVEVQPGQARLDGVVEIAAPMSAVVFDDAVSFAWLQRDGTVWFSQTMSAPPQPAVYLGAVTAVEGEVAVLDASGVIRQEGGLAVRRTADRGVPAVLPPTGMSFVQVGAVGTYLAVNGGWLALQPAGTLTLDMEDSDQVLTDAEAGVATILVVGALSQPRELTLPLGNGLTFTVRHKGTGNSIWVGGATGDRVEVLPGQTRLIACDGEDYYSLAAGV